MELKGKVAVITGAASGIGRAAALRFAREGVAGLVLADLNMAALKPVAEEAKGLAVACDVSREPDIQGLVRQAEERYGRIDVYFSNAGIIRRGGLEAGDADWDRNWRIHVMAHVWAARAVVEKMVARDVHSPHRWSEVASGLRALEKVPEVVLQLLRVLLRTHAVHASRPILPGASIGFS
jgi:NAD(P)-dependent dehydrogenase (short-subunit alcohol dehydrogenase family)